MVTFRSCSTVLSGGTCTNRACRRRHDITRCEPCGCSLPLGSLEEHSRGQKHLRNVPPNRTPTPVESEHLPTPPPEDPPTPPSEDPPTRSLNILLPRRLTLNIPNWRRLLLHRHQLSPCQRMTHSSRCLMKVASISKSKELKLRGSILFFHSVSTSS
ncbi:hypothetical protein EI94DRAFT_1245894 [Lactarius quietus]|nr:hypothetical protein EI94DRAFT_1245894 [Lactarius quietus]